MTDLRYVCLSDMHFGAENSILTALRPGTVEIDFRNPSLALTGLLDCLRTLVEANSGSQRPTLILAGDIVEFALATENEAGMVFELFVEAAFKERPIFDDVIYFVPGNHDHHLWEGAREKQYSDYVRSRHTSKHLETPWHTTRMRTETDKYAVESELLTAHVQRTLGRETPVRVRIVYPNLALDASTSNRHVFVHHGHYVEGMYRLMSTLRDMVFPDQRKAPKDVHVWEWESENFAWIDFFWSSLGRSGAVGADVGLVYASLQSRDALRILRKNLARGLAERPPRPRWVQGLKAWTLGRLLGRVTNRTTHLERGHKEAELSPGAQEGLKTYLECPLRNQINIEYEPGDGELLEDLTFVFGHTHKPFEDRQAFEGYPQPIRLYNTGGWVVDTKDTRPLHGAAAILFDEELNSASLRLYNQSDDKSSYRVDVAQSGGRNPFSTRVAGLVQPEEEPWSGFSKVAADLVEQRHRDLDAIIKKHPGLAPELQA
jgi:predicted phosphodiesterase